MQKTFTAKDAKRLIEKHEQMLDALKEGSLEANKLRYDVNEASKNWIEQKVLAQLAKTPAKELAKDDKSIPVKALEENGFKTVADIYKSATISLMSQTVSEDGARAAKKSASDYAARLREPIKIKLNPDSRDPASTRLVRAIGVYKNSLPYSTECGALLLANEKEIREHIKSLSVATNPARWAFASTKAKERAIAAYDALVSLIRGAYGDKARASMKSLRIAGRLVADAAWRAFIGNSIDFYTALEKSSPGKTAFSAASYIASGDLPAYLASEVQAEPLHLDGLKCTLRRYQETGAKYALHQKRVLLGDEMGLGKTVQAIAAMLSLYNEGATHFAVVCPASVVANWCREIERHSILRAVKIHGNDKLSSFNDWLANGGVAVTTYETSKVMDLPDGFTISLLVVDEAHYIKNPAAQRTASVLRLMDHAERRMLMTGTALENRPDEMRALISMLSPSLAAEIYGMGAGKFREKVSPVYFRRRRSDVLTELPELIESEVWCTLTEDEELAYEESVLNGSFMQARRVSWDVPLENSSKMASLAAIVDEAKEDGRKVLIFSYFLDTVQKISAYFGEQCVGTITGDVPAQKRQQLVDALDQAEDGSVLVCQITAGGTGLNIQSASVVVICEPQLKPSIENQAISRAYRMGQARAVLVYRLLTENTIDEHIHKILKDKQAIFDTYADQSVAAKELGALEIDDETLSTAFADEQDRINKKRK